jgi:Uncharacterised nucleotidyltransferase
MPLKGVLLGALGILSPAQRALRDADLLVDTPCLGGVVAKLGRAGFKVCDVPIAPGKVSVSHADHGSFWLDIHTQPMPRGLSRITCHYMFEGARPDDRLFGVRVYVPAPERLVVALIGNVAKDRIALAEPHTSADVAAALRVLGPDGVDLVARELRAVSLCRVGALVCARAHRLLREGGAAEEAIAGLRQLELQLISAAERAAFERRLAAVQRTDRGELVARLRARAGSDSWGLSLQAPLWALLGAATWGPRRLYLQARNQGDVSLPLR